MAGIPYFFNIDFQVFIFFFFALSVLYRDILRTPREVSCSQFGETVILIIVASLNTFTYVHSPLRNYVK